MSIFPLIVAGTTSKSSFRGRSGGRPNQQNLELRPLHDRQVSLKRSQTSVAPACVTSIVIY